MATDADDLAEDEELWAQIGIAWSERSTSSAMTKQRSPRTTLSMTLDPELLRATPAAVALSGWCKHWQCSESRDGQRLYELSAPVETIDVFLSHDWGTSRWMKLLALLVVFNSRAAAVTSMLLSVIMGVVMISLGQEALPLKLWIFCGYGAFVFQFCFWQRIRGFFCCAPIQVFLDKLCIHQTDMELKQQGIDGLAAFVRGSTKILVLWSHRYFNRLWCAYEIGCFLSRANRVSMNILPVKTSMMLVLTGVLWHALMFSYYIVLLSFNAVTETNPTTPRFLYISFLTVGVATSLLPVVNYLGMSLMDDMEQLPKQVQNFRIQEAECACCSQNHLHPETGQKLICDRQLVYHSLLEIYGQNCLDPLERFNQQVRDSLGPKVLWRLGVLGAYLPLRYVVCIVMASNFPFLSELIWRISQGPQAPLFGAEYAVWCMRLVLQWVQPFLAMFFSLEFSVRIWKLKNVLKIPRVLLAILRSPLQSMGVGIVFASMELAVRFSADQSWWPLLPFSVAMLLNFGLHVL